MFGHPLLVHRLVIATAVGCVLGDGLWTSSLEFTELPQLGARISTDSAQPLDRRAPAGLKIGGNRGPALGPTFDPDDEIGHLVVDLVTLLHQASDLLHGVHDRGMVPAPEL